MGAGGVSGSGSGEGSAVAQQVLVTGASSGIGAAAAAALVRAGYDVVGPSRNAVGATATDGVTLPGLVDEVIK